MHKIAYARLQLTNQGLTYWRALIVAKSDLAVLRRNNDETGRSVEEAVSYAVGHRTRIEILAALHEGPASAKQLAKVVGQPLSNVTHHIEELLASGSIDVAYTEPVGNITQNFYCMVKLPFYSDEDIAMMTRHERQVLAGIILQAIAAEALASLWAGKLHSDPRVWLAWNRIRLDEQGRNNLADEQQRSWDRITEIEAESANRRAESDDPGKTYVVTSLGYERSRTEAPEPIHPEKSWPAGKRRSSSQYVLLLLLLEQFNSQPTPITPLGLGRDKPALLARARVTGPFPLVAGVGRRFNANMHPTSSHNAPRSCPPFGQDGRQDDG